MLLSALLLPACAPRPQDCTRADVFCAGLVTASGSVDEGINREAWLGLQDAKAEKLVDRIDYIETVDLRDRAKNVATLAEDGYDVIVTVGAAISDETIAAAQKYTNTLFIGVEQEQDSKYQNLTGLVFHEEYSGFLAGALAALITQTNRIAAVCEANFIDSVRRYCDGFQAGAKYANPDVNMNLSYREGPEENLFNDPTWGRETALKFVNEGVNVLFAAGGGTADAALEAAAAQGAYVISAETDPYERLTEIHPRLATSAINHIRSGVRDLMRLARQRRFPSGEFTGQVGLAPFHDLDAQIPLNVKERVEEIRVGLENSSIHLEAPYRSR